MTVKDINNSFGNIDLFLFDQLLKGRFRDKKSILDAGCGEGRNLSYFINNDFQVTGIDTNQEALTYARLVFKGKGHFINTSIESASLDHFFDSIICINVLHHSQSEDQYRNIWKKLTSLLHHQGFFFVRTLLSKEGEAFKKDQEDNLLISINQLEQLVEESKLKWLEPLKIESLKKNDLAVIALEKN